jgi:predicted nucleic acid-binding protein
MNGFKSAFLDTALFIYLIEGHPQFAPIVKDILIHCRNQSVLLTTSVLTGLEFKIKPLRANRTDIISAFDELIAESNIKVIAITAEVIENALSLQTQLLSLKALDSMQLGAAVVHQCDVFMTNDKRLAPINKPQIITLDQWK